VVTSLLLRRLPAHEGHFNRVSARMGVEREQQGSQTGTESVLAAWLAALRAGVALLTNPQTWHSVLDALFGAFILGGVFVVPVAGVAALISVWLPAFLPLHWMASQMFGFAILWFIASLFGAHLRQRRHQEEPAK
jgi:hypothetical protein